MALTNCKNCGDLTEVNNCGVGGCCWCPICGDAHDGQPCPEADDYTASQ